MGVRDPLVRAGRAVVPAPIKRKVKSLLGGAPADKYDWEFRWQQTQWLELWVQPQNQAKCLEYWRRFRHLDDIRTLITIDDDSDVLDVGCGLSSVLHFLPGRRVGIDPLGDRYRSIYQYPFDVVTAPGESLPFEDESFDAVFSSNCIDHTSDPDRVLAEVGRVLRHGGRFALTAEIYTEDLGERNAGHPHTFTLDSLRALCSRRFRIVAEWTEPWYGLQPYCLGVFEEGQREHVLVLE
jgi:SAM-dependent methyltransferase